MRLKLACILTLFTVFCSGSVIRRLDIKPIPQTVAFHHSYVNDALGYQNRGWFIDNEGVVKAYRRDSTDTWYTVERSGPDSGFISDAAMVVNYKFASRIIYRVPMLELRRYFDLVPAVSKGEPGERLHVNVGMGDSRNISYLWDSRKGKYREILVSISGDWEQKNLSPDAVSLDDWLNGINRIYYDSLSVKPRQDDRMPIEIRDR